MENMLIKVCGMRNAENITSVMQLKVDLIGLIFYEKSPRFVEKDGLMESDIDAIKHIKAKRVGVFVNAGIDLIANKIRLYDLDCVQLHGNETEAFCRQLQQLPEMKNKLIFKAINISTENDLDLCAKYEGIADMFVFDTKSTLGGGSGMQFSWDVLDNYNGKTPYLLSGGISSSDAQRVADFKASHKMCLGIDLNSRFETEPAVKNIGLLQTFINELQISTGATEQKNN